MAFLFILGGLCVNAAETALTFTGWEFPGAEPAWGNSYSSHTATFDLATVTFTNASKQTGTVTDCPVMKAGTVTVEFKDIAVSHVKFNLKQWGTKTKTATLSTSIDGTNFVDANVSSSTFVLESDLPSGVKAVRMSFTDTKNQVGLSSIDLVYEGTVTPSEPVAYEPNFADVEIWEGNTAQIELGSKHPTSMIFVPEDETVASVDENGLITAHKIGSTTVTVSWDADDNFLAATEDVVFNVNVVEKPEVSEGTFDFSVKDPYGITSTSDGNHYETTATTCEDGIVTCVVDGKYRAWVKSNAYDIRLYKADSGKDNVGTFTISVPNGYKLVTVEFVDGIDGGIALKPSVGTLENNVWTAGANDGIVAFTATATTKVSKIIASYTVAFPKFEGTEHSFTTESSEIRIADADHAFDIFYRHTPAPAQNNVVARAEGEIADSFENKAEFDETNGQHVIPVSESGTLSYYAVHTATGKQSETNSITVTKTATTAIDAIGADNAEGEAEFFDIRGVKVNIDNAAPGLYIRRQGTTATKVVVK